MNFEEYDIAEMTICEILADGTYLTVRPKEGRVEEDGDWVQFYDFKTDRQMAVLKPNIIKVVFR